MTMARRRARASLSGALAGAVALGVLGCELTTVELADVADVVVAEVYLRAGADVHQAFLHRTFPGPDGSLRVDGASIVVRGPGGEAFVFEPVADHGVCALNELMPEGVAGSCYTAPDQGRVVHGRSYDLEITLPDGRRLEGRTTVPAGFELVRPVPPTCVLEGTSLEFVWTRSEGAWAYQADALFTGLAPGLADRGVVDPPDTLRLLGLSIGANDTTMTFPGDFGVFDRYQLDLDVLLALQEGLPEGARADIVIAAGDRNYVNWVRGGNFNPSGQVRISSVTGDGVGVFGALVGRGRTVLAPGTELESGEWPACEAPGVTSAGP